MYRSVVSLFLIGSLLNAAYGEKSIRWAIALHGGAGRLDPEMSPEVRDEYKRVLNEALDTGIAVLSEGGSALDATEQTVTALEDCPLFNAGRGSVFDRAGGHAMDASIMDGATLACGGVASVTTLRNPIRGARLVMERTPHVLLGGADAERFCAAQGAVLAHRSYFSTRRRFEKLQKAMRDDGLVPPSEPLHGWPAEEAVLDDAAVEVGGTVGCVALDVDGKLAAATSTGGRNNKLVGRIGDSPVPGAGNYANGHVAVGGTGKGEEFLRHSVTARVGWLVESGAKDVRGAVDHCLNEVLKPGDGGLIAIDHKGRIVMRTTTGSMPSAAADSGGSRRVAVFYE